MRVGDTLLGGMLLIFAAALAGYSQTFPTIPSQAYGAATFPTAVAIGLAGCGAMLVYGGIRAGHRHLERAEWMADGRAVVSVLLTVLAVVAYLLLAPRIGFVPVMSAMLLGLFLLMRVDWRIAVPAAVASTIAIDGLFAGVLLVPLPIGLFPRIPW